MNMMKGLLVLAIFVLTIVEHVAGEKQCYQCLWIKGLRADICSDENFNLTSSEVCSDENCYITSSKVQIVTCPDDKFCFKATLGETHGSRGCDTGTCTQAGTFSYSPEGTKAQVIRSCCNSTLCNGGTKGSSINFVNKNNGNQINQSNFTVVVAAIIFVICTAY
ncbi:uncharacterized protein [Amphiura filiformis]|uniref:uncharacterized protein n=1 Tax=Amphiura filiformis TaxID=82378 RepID=UPI003B22049F